MSFDVGDREVALERFRRRGAVDASLRRLSGPPESWHLELVFAGRRGLRIQADAPDLAGVELIMLRTMRDRGIGELLFQDLVELRGDDT